MTSGELVEKLADQAVELHATGGQVVGLPWSPGDSPAHRRALILAQARVADLLLERGWRVRVALLIDPEDQPDQAA
jgi:hypothetical protein